MDSWKEFFEIIGMMIIGIGAVIVTVIIIGLIASPFAIWEKEEGNKLCVSKFGYGWEWRDGFRSPDVCVDAGGNMKMP